MYIMVRGQLKKQNLFVTPSFYGVFSLHYAIVMINARCFGAMTSLTYLNSRRNDRPKSVLNHSMKCNYNKACLKLKQITKVRVL